jgi:ketosteroid isomerase-like protein
MSCRMPIAFMILLLALTGWRPADSVADTDIANIKAFNQAYDAAHKSADVNRIAILWAQDGIMLPPGEPAVMGSREIHAWLTANRPDPSVAMISSHVSRWRDIVVSGDYAFQWAQTYIEVRSSDGLKGAHMSGTALQVLRKEPDGSWKLLRSSWSHGARQKVKATTP